MMQLVCWPLTQKVVLADPRNGKQRGGVGNDNHKPSRSKVWRSSSR